MPHVVCDESRCTGCLACVVKCIDRHYAEDAVEYVPLRLHTLRQLPSGLMQYYTDSCRHCTEAACMEQCPVKAIFRDENGFIQIDHAACVGCRRCVQVCPYGIPHYGKTRKPYKCDGCSGAEPACVAVCPRGALKMEMDEN